MKKRSRMTLIEILTEIKKNRVELEVYQELHKWIIADRKKWIDRTNEVCSSLRVIDKFANANIKTKDAIEAIRLICDSDEDK